GRNGSHFTPLLQSRRARTQNGFSSCKYHCTNFSPKNIHVSAPKARYGPNGNFADQTRFPTSKVASPTTEPTTEPAKLLNKTPRHPRKAPIAARNFKSPRPIASRGISSSCATPKIRSTVSSTNSSVPTPTRL